MIIWRRGSTALGLLVGREELSLAASWALLFLQDPGLCTLLMEQVLALELNNCLLVQDWVLADRTVQSVLILLIMINCLLHFASLLHDLVEGDIVLLLVYFLEYASV